MALEVTNIKVIDNNSGKTVAFSKRENHDNDYTLLDNSTVTEDVWIPWVNNRSEFNQKVIVIDYYNSTKKFYIWQSGQRIRYSKTGYSSSADAIPGDSKVGGNKQLILGRNAIRLEDDE